MQTSDNKFVTLADLVEKFDLSTSADSGKLNSLYRKALKSLVAFAGDAGEWPLTDLDRLIGGWIVSLRVRDFSLKTASDYLMSISGIYSRAGKTGSVPEADVFATLRARLKEEGKELWSSGVRPADFERFSALVRSELTKQNSDDIGADLMLLSLLNGCLPTADVARWKKDDDLSDIATPELLKRAIVKCGREYLFPLNHGKRTPKQFAGDVNGLIIKFMTRHCIPTFGDADSTIRSYWGFAALRAGADASGVISAMPALPEGLRFLELSGEPGGSGQSGADLKEVVNPMFLGDPMRWYAMRLRARVTYDDLVRRFADEKSLRMPETFYPTREIARHIGKKVVFEEQPFINDVVFFRSRYDRIAPLFCRIGDMAWCYKTSRGLGATYAPVSRKSLDRFQRAIGCFTPEFMAAHQSDAILSKGDTVRITGGSLQNLSGTVKEIEKSGPEGILTYLIDICNGYARSFTANVDYRQVEKLPTRG